MEKTMNQVPLTLEGFPFEVPGLFKVVCCECKVKIGYKRSGKAESTGVSHGYCPACYEAQKREIDAFAAI